MSKRKNADGYKPSGANIAKKPRTADGDQSLDSAVLRAQLASHAVVQTLDLVDALQSTAGSFKQRMQIVADLLNKDAARSESLLDLSLVVEGESVGRCIGTGDTAASAALIRR